MDQNTLRAAQQGDTKAFDELVKEYLPLVYHYVARLTHTTSLAEDITQETFIKAWKYIKRFDTTKPFHPWLMRIARNAALDALKRHKTPAFSFLSADEQSHIESLPDNNLTPHQKAEQTETTAYVNHILSTLKPTEQEVLSLHYQEELSISEIAEVLQVPLETVRTRLRRARASFRTIIEPDARRSIVLPNKGTYASISSQQSQPTLELSLSNP